MTDLSAVTALGMRNVGVTYRTGLRSRARIEALQDVTIALEAGSVTGLVGVNGAGKTTLLEVAIGALDPTVGVVRWFNRQAWDRATRRRIGFCPDTPAFPPFLNVRETLCLFCSLRGITGTTIPTVVERSLVRFRLEELAAVRVSRLSRGNAVRLGLAQALLGEPDLIILDESFAPLDPRGQADLRTTLGEEAARGAAVLISSHQLDQVRRVAHHVLVLESGRVIRQMDRNELDDPGAERALEDVLGGVVGARETNRSEHDEG